MEVFPCPGLSGDSELRCLVFASTDLLAVQVASAGAKAKGKKLCVCVCVGGGGVLDL